MPPKKKRTVAPSEKPGVARQFIEENFHCVPSEGVKNGHILFLYLQSDKSFADTVTLLKQKLVGDWKIVSRDISLVVNKAKFTEMCNKLFVLKPAVQAEDVPVPGPSRDRSPSPVASTLKATPVTSLTSPRLSARGTDSTPRKLKLRKRLAFVSRSKDKEKKNLKTNIQALREELRSVKRKRNVKVLNQRIKRMSLMIAQKNTLILSLKNELKSDEKYSYVDKLKRVHSSLIRYNERQRARSVPLERFRVLQKKEKESQNIVNTLQYENLMLKEEVKDLSSTSLSVNVKDDKKTYSCDVRMMVFDCIVNNVPTKSTPTVIHTILKHAGVSLDSVPHRTTVEQMTRELGVISDYFVSEVLMNNHDLTLGFDATTQEGVHINSVHVTTKNECNVLSVDELPGGTARDYAGHISESIRRISEVYAAYTNTDFEECRQTIVANVKNTLTDRAAVNGVTVALLEEEWGTTVNELNCHLHPLDTIASSCRSVLKQDEPVKGKLFGWDCIAANILLAMNKIRFKDGKGDPKAFISFLESTGLGKGFIVRYRGNRLHVLFELCGRYFEQHAAFRDFLSTSVLTCSKLQVAACADFESAVAITELHVLGLVGKLLSGPWMAKFYQSATSNVSHVDAIDLVAQVIDRMRAAAARPLGTLTTTSDFFDDELTRDARLNCLQQNPGEPQLFAAMMSKCLTASVAVLERQYRRYFATDITEQPRIETETARLHNMDSEEIIGMVSAAMFKAPGATIDYLTAKIRAQKNKIVQKLDDTEVE